MGYTTSIPEPELQRGDGPPPCEGHDIDVKAKQVVPEEKPEPKKSTARSKAK